MGAVVVDHLSTTCCLCRKPLTRGIVLRFDAICQECGQEIASVISAEEPFTCKICGQTFDNRGRYIRHGREHSQEKGA